MIFEGPGKVPLHTLGSTSQQELCNTNAPSGLVSGMLLAHQKKIAQSQSPAIPALMEPNRQKSRRKEGFWEIAARNRKSLATFHRTLKSQCSIAFSCLGSRSRFLGSTIGISQLQVAKNRCDLGALRVGCQKPQTPFFLENPLIFP